MAFVCIISNLLLHKTAFSLHPFLVFSELLRLHHVFGSRTSKRPQKWMYSFCSWSGKTFSPVPTPNYQCITLKIPSVMESESAPISQKQLNNWTGFSIYSLLWSFIYYLLSILSYNRKGFLPAETSALRGPICSQKENVTSDLGILLSYSLPWPCNGSVWLLVFGAILSSTPRSKPLQRSSVNQPSLWLNVRCLQTCFDVGSFLCLVPGCVILLVPGWERNKENVEKRRATKHFNNNIKKI